MRARPSVQHRFRPYRRRTAAGAAPGSIVPESDAPAPRLSLLAYGPDGFEERTLADTEELRGLIGLWPVIWVNVDGLGDPELIERLGRIFDLHRLALEDVVNTHQRPKTEDYDDRLFVATRMVSLAAPELTEQLTLFIGRDYVLTFQERPGDSLEPVRERIRRHRGQIRNLGPDYLAYALIDAAIDGFFPALESYGAALERLEDEVMIRPESRHVAEIHALKRDLFALRRAIFPQRDMVNALIRDDSPFIADHTRIYLRDCYDHTFQLLDLVETYREVSSGLLDVYLSSQSARMNEIIKVLTIIATIFMPLGFIAGLYGMNFDPAASPFNMPELEWRYGYAFALALMLAVAAGLLVFFRRKGWIGGARSGRRKRRRSPPA